MVLRLSQVNYSVIIIILLRFLVSRMAVEMYSILTTCALTEVFVGVFCLVSFFLIELCKTSPDELSLRTRVQQIRIWEQFMM